MSSNDYIALNKANWDERAAPHAKSPAYDVERLIADPELISRVVEFDKPLLGDITGLEVVHLQCHIGTDTLSLVRRGASRAVGLDFSANSLAEARRLAASAAGGDKLSFVEASVYDAAQVLPPASFDLVFTGIGALCWLPDVRRWAQVVAALLKPGGRFFIREDHPMAMTMSETITDKLVVEEAYFEHEKPLVCESDISYVPIEEGTAFKANVTHQWNHSLGEIIQALLDAGLRITGLVEHRSVPWESITGQMQELGGGEWGLKEGRDRLPLSYTLQAVKN